MRRKGTQGTHEKGRNELHADRERVAGRIPRVRLRVLFPDLGQEIDLRGRSIEARVEDDVPFDDEVDEGGEDEPGDDGALARGDGGEAGCLLILRRKKRGRGRGLRLQPSSSVGRQFDVEFVVDSKKENSTFARR